MKNNHIPQARIFFSSIDRRALEKRKSRYIVVFLLFIMCIFVGHVDRNVY